MDTPMRGHFSGSSSLALASFSLTRDVATAFSPSFPRKRESMLISIATVSTSKPTLRQVSANVTTNCTA
jgi:hypothetical protein